MPPTATLTAEDLRQRAVSKPAGNVRESVQNVKASKSQLGERKASEGKQVWWINGVFVAFAHAAALASLVFVTPKWQTLVLTFVCVVLAELGITMGYHRLWSHRSYTATPALRVLLALMGTSAFQGSIKWWVLRHRLHHRYTDDNTHDPYSAGRGFWFSHIGWIFERPTYTRIGMVDASDLNEDPGMFSIHFGASSSGILSAVVVFQHKHFVPLAFSTSFLIPTLLGALWGDAFAAYLYAGIIARVLIWHATFCINSFAHWIGDQEFSNWGSARGTFLLAFITQGEGYHNFHHEFPKDYRNGIHPLDWDPTKWLIALAARLGLARNLFTYPENEIAKARVTTLEDKARRARVGLDWGPKVETLPTVKWGDVETVVGHAEWMVLDGGEHPGGVKLLDAYKGKDAGKGFYGVLNNHSKSARSMVEMMRVARVVE
ncbi:hypothetical protein BC830DRAFT_1213393 [Chytriomyces sp. MP71]|nr:hypothetical protein BC830DRAFT_1213393 [Chytriomyces sp. MP71]